MKNSQYGECGLYCGGCGATDCDGCRSDRVDETVGRCTFRRCSRERNVEFCCFCGEYPCKELHTYIHARSMAAPLDYGAESGVHQAAWQAGVAGGTGDTMVLQELWCPDFLVSEVLHVRPAAGGLGPAGVIPRRSSVCHPRAEPALDLVGGGGPRTHSKSLDSRLRGNDMASALAP